MTRVGIVGVVGALAMNAPCARAGVCGKSSGGANWMAGPIFGIQLSGSSGVLVGVEGGAGCGPERVNVGLEYRAGVGFGYVELDPWLLLGASLGIGVDSNHDVQPIVGLWEGIPTSLGGSCGSTENQSITTISFGYRFTGVHELYLAIKAGTTQALACWD